MKQSKKFSINWVDAGKGLIVAGLTSLLVFAQESIDSGSLQFHWKPCAMAFIGGAVGYLIKNFFTAPPK